MTRASRSGGCRRWVAAALVGFVGGLVTLFLRLYVVPRFSFTPLAAAAAQDNLFIYPQFEVEQPWAPGKTSATARVTYWAVANVAPWPIAESVVTVVRTSLVNGVRRPVDDQGRASAKKD